MKSTLRWILLLPGALSAGYLAFLIGGTLNRFSMNMFIGPSEGWYNLAAIFMEQMYFGGVMLYIGGRIAPHHKSYTILGLSGLILLFVGYSIALVIGPTSIPLSISPSEYGASAGGLLFAIVAFAFGLLAGELGDNAPS